MTEHENFIKEAVIKRGQFSHNVISCALRCIEKEEGTAAANAVIDKYKLSARYGIEKQ